MNWNTIYITGNDNFWEEVNKKLSNSDLSYLNGFVEQLPDGKYQGLYWLDNKVDLRTFKEAITGKLVWKYRLNFFHELEQPTKIKSNDDNPESLSIKENALLKAMRNNSSIGA
jgi:hypothetical protein